MLQSRSIKALRQATNIVLFTEIMRQNEESSSLKQAKQSASGGRGIILCQEGKQDYFMAISSPIGRLLSLFSGETDVNLTHYFWKQHSLSVCLENWRTFRYFGLETRQSQWVWPMALQPITTLHLSVILHMLVCWYWIGCLGGRGLMEGVWLNWAIEYSEIINF